MNNTYVNACLRWLVNELYPFYEKDKLPKEFVSKMNTFYSSVSKDFDWENPDKTTLKTLGFLNWEDESETDCVWFIPRWLYPAIPDGLILYDRKKQPFEFSHTQETDDVMFGCLPYGILVSTEVLDNYDL